MSRVFRHALIFSLVLSLVASAAAWRQCTGLQMVAAAAAAGIGHSAHGSDRAAMGHGEADRHGMHHQHMAADPGAPAAPAADDHGCMKCCAMCTVAMTLPPAAPGVVTFIVSSHAFSRDQESASGNTVAVDPGIPKRIA